MQTGVSHLAFCVDVNTDFYQLFDGLQILVNHSDIERCTTQLVLKVELFGQEHFTHRSKILNLVVSGGLRNELLLLSQVVILTLLSWHEFKGD